MNFTIFKTWHMASDKVHYWVDELPPHEDYNLILGQAIIPDSVYIKYVKLPLVEALAESYEYVHNEYRRNK